jgi:hypothetical protein
VVGTEFNEAEARAIKARRTTHKAHGDRNDPEERKINGTDYANLMRQSTLGWRPICPCPPHEPRPALVLDPFSGSQRVGIQAGRMGLDYIGIELSPDYVAIGKRLLEAESPLFSGVDVSLPDAR